MRCPTPVPCWSRTLVLGMLAALSGAAAAQPAEPTPFQQRVIAAMQGDIRTAEFLIQQKIDPATQERQPHACGSARVFPRA